MELNEQFISDLTILSSAEMCCFSFAEIKETNWLFVAELEFFRAIATF